MKKVKTEVKTFMVRLMCDCGTEMKRGNYVLDSYPPIYPYNCPNCEETTQENKQYPYTEYKEISNDA